MLERVMAVVFVFVMAFGAIACDSKKSDEGGEDKPSAEKVDLAAIEAGKSATFKLKFWMTERGVTETGLVPVLHFFDADEQRIVVVYDEAAMAEQIAGLKQNDIYSVTFTRDQGDNFAGTVTKIE